MQLGVTDDSCSSDLKWYPVSSILPVSTRMKCHLYKDYLPNNELEFRNRHLSYWLNSVPDSVVTMNTRSFKWWHLSLFNKCHSNINSQRTVWIPRQMRMRSRQEEREAGQQERSQQRSKTGQLRQVFYIFLT